jgi:hypothetical protein
VAYSAADENHQNVTHESLQTTKLYDGTRRRSDNDNLLAALDLGYAAVFCHAAAA